MEGGREGWIGGVEGRVGRWKGGVKGGRREFEIGRVNFNSVFRFPPREYKNVLIFLLYTLSSIFWGGGWASVTIVSMRGLSLFLYRHYTGVGVGDCHYSVNAVSVSILV